jgi:serine/threonine protein phosphatase PrpC
VVTLSGSRNLILKLQDKDLCQEYSRLFKEQNREKDMNKEQELKKQCEKIKKKIENIIRHDYNIKDDYNY